MARTYSAVESRAIAFADVDLFVNICSAMILILGQGWLLRRFGVTFGLVLSPILMVGAFAALALAPTFLVVQSARALQRISQYAIARPSREILFTVVDQQSRYKAKNVIDTSVYRFGDLTAAWMQAQGLKVAQLDGGILNYLATFDDAAADWQGECYVFDKRIAIDAAGRETGTTAEQVFTDPADAWRLNRARRLDPAAED